MATRVMLVINPNAGKSGYKSAIAPILETFSRHDYLPTVYLTRAVGDATSFVRTQSAPYDIVVCLGGDGTLSEVVSGMMAAPDKKPIGYIPMGTANDVAHTLGLSTDPLTSAEQIVRAHPLPFDVGQFGSQHYFTYVAAFGAFTEVSYATPQENKKALGHMAYMLEGLMHLSSITDCHAVVEYDDGVVSDNYIFGAVSNSTSIAGLVHLRPEEVNLSDGMFEILLIRTPQNLLELNNVITAIMSQNFQSPNLLMLRSKQVRFTFDTPIAWTRDGEDGGKHQDVLICACHPAVEILV